MGFLLTISQPTAEPKVIDAVVGAALAVLGLRGGATAEPIGMFVKRTKGDERFVSFVRLITPTVETLSATRLHRALESALAAAELDDAQVQVLEDLPPRNAP